MVEPHVNRSHSFLLGQPGGEESSCQPSWPQSDREEVSRGGTGLAETFSIESAPQAGGDCKVQGRKAIAKPGFCRVHGWEVETLASKSNNLTAAVSSSV